MFRDNRVLKGLNVDEMTSGGGSAEPQDLTTETNEAWQRLQVGLAEQLGNMTDEDDHLVMELPSGGDRGEVGTTPYAQFAGFGDRMVRAELSGDAYLAPLHRLDAESASSLSLGGWLGNDNEELNWYLERSVADANLLALTVVWALRDVFGVTHPQLLTFNAWGPNSASADVLGLGATADVPAELAIEQLEDPAEPLVLSPSDRDELVEMVLMVLQAKLGERPTVDDDGDAVLIHLGQPVRVRVRHEQPAIEIFARVAHDVRSRRATAVELAVLNSGNSWVKWSQRERTVWQHLVIPGAPFVPAHLDGMVDVFLETMTKTRDDLVFRVLGKAS